MDTIEDGSPDQAGQPGPRRGSIAAVVAVSLLVGLALVVVMLMAPVIPTRTTSLTGAILLAFGAGWALFAVLSTRFIDQPQRWSIALAAFMGLAASLAFSGSAAAHAIFSWVWPLLLAGILVWTLYSIRHQVPSRLGRWLLYPVIAALGLAALGGGYATVSTTLNARAQTPPGALVSIGDHRLHLQCTGTGSPTVVLEPGLGGSSSDMHWITSAVAADTQVCVYDRAGRGWSDGANSPQDAAHIAADLHTLLDRAQIPGPYVLAGHSFGGLYSLSFAAQFPDQVAGMVLLDSTAPRSASADTSDSDPDSAVGRIAAVAPGIGHLGAGRDLGSFLQEFLEGSASVQQAAALTDLHGKPLIVVTADTGHDAAWQAAQQHLTTLSTNSLQRIAHATHQTLVDDPAASAPASLAIGDLVTSLRTSQPLRSR
ncbi:MAG TPA: alpha/beta hydrolase [Microlunatus sp.]